jgi:hypothetical protein
MQASRHGAFGMSKDGHENEKNQKNTRNFLFTEFAIGISSG